MTAQPCVQLFYNPVSGRYSAGEIERLAASFRNLAADVVLSPSQGQPPTISARATHICIAGGDGTVRHVAAAVAATTRDLPISVYPLGTVNLLARENRSSRDCCALARRLLTCGQTRDHHPVSINGNDWFFACASVGPDSLAIAATSSRMKALFGRTAYLATILRMLVQWPRHPLRLIIGEQVHSCEAVYIAKGRFYAGPWSFAPQARTDDGLLHVVALREARRRDYLQFCLALALGRDPADLTNTTALTCTALRLEAQERMPLQCDGDSAGHLPAALAVSPTPVRVC